MRARHRLSAAFVKAAPAGKWCDGAGLWLVRRPDGGAQWVLRLTVHGRRREMGLGAPPAVTLAQARDRAERWRAVVADGRDPIKARAADARASQRADISLSAITADAFEAKRSSLKGDGKAGRWMSPIENHLLPRLGKVPVTDLDQRDIRDALAGIWHSKGETARKALNRLDIVLRHAAALGIEVDLQAPAKAKALLGKSRHEGHHIPAMHWRDVPGFYASLAEPTITHLALRLLILTGVRSAPLRFLRLDHLDGDAWTIPGELMKGQRGRTVAFRVPLSAEAQRCIDLAKPFERDGYLFPSVRKGVISDATMARLMERRGMAERPHGFRSSLRVWLAEATSAPHEVAEAVLGHVTDGAVVRAYRRTDFLDQRRILMERWADHVTGGDGAVVRLKGAAG